MGQHTHSSTLHAHIEHFMVRSGWCGKLVRFIAVLGMAMYFFELLDFK